MDSQNLLQCTERFIIKKKTDIFDANIWPEDILITNIFQNCVIRHLFLYNVEQNSIIN